MKRTACAATALACALLVGVALAGKNEKASKKEAKTPLALEGNCAVCLVNSGKLVPGKAEHSVVYDGREYRFPDAGTRLKFLADPAKYVPALGGDCTVCYAAHAGKRSPGKLAYRSMYKGRLFLFPNEMIKTVFDKAPQKFADVDLAFGGKCVVCYVDTKSEVAGKPEYTAVFEGFRYQFPSNSVREKFLADPDKYVVKLDELTKVSATGKTTCAACEYSVHPMLDPDQLGLAVVGNDGKVYIVEKAHKNYKKIYESRFENLPVKVTGREIGREGNFIWIDDAKVTQIKSE